MAEKMLRRRELRLSERLDDALVKRAAMSGVTESMIIRAALEQFLGTVPTTKQSTIDRVLARQALFTSLAIEALATKAGIKTDELVQLAKERVGTLFHGTGGQ